ncbi:MAG: efflux RND transporter permease subunit [Paludibacteraceae bacterium]
MWGTIFFISFVVSGNLIPPIISVRTSYAGANAEIVESQITEPLEKSINGN